MALPTLTPELEDKILRDTLDRLRAKIGTGAAGVEENLMATEIGNALYDFDRRVSSLPNPTMKQALRDEVLDPVLHRLGVAADRPTRTPLTWDTVTRPDGSMLRVNNETGQVLPFNDALPAPTAAPSRAQSPGFFYAGTKLPEPLTTGVGYDTRGEAAARAEYDASPQGIAAALPPAAAQENPLTGPMARPAATRTLRIGDNEEGLEPGTYEAGPDGLKRLGPLPPQAPRAVHYNVVDFPEGNADGLQPGRYRVGTDKSLERLGPLPATNAGHVNQDTRLKIDRLSDKLKVVEKQQEEGDSNGWATADPAKISPRSRAKFDAYRQREEERRKLNLDIDSLIEGKPKGTNSASSGGLKILSITKE